MEFEGERSAMGNSGENFGCKGGVTKTFLQVLN